MNKFSISNVLILLPGLLCPAVATAQTPPAPQTHATAAAPVNTFDPYRRISVAGEVSPAYYAKAVLSNDLCDQGETQLQNKDYLGAEQSFQDSLAAAKLSATGNNPAATRGLAEVYALEGKTAEAEQMYRTLIDGQALKWSSIAQESRTRMGFAILLSQTGRWAEAVSVYRSGLSYLASADAPKLDVAFDPQVPQPKQLQALAYTAIGLQFSGYADTIRAFAEFDKAKQIAPNMEIVNSLYRSGWQHLNSAERTKFVPATQSKMAVNALPIATKP